MIVVVAGEPSYISTHKNKQVAQLFWDLKTVGVDRPTDMLFVTDSFQEAVAAKTAGNLFLELIFLFLQIITLVINVMF